ncbi:MULTISPECIES: DnaA regulatory inactivator Hda [Thiothrix]|jgi:DnaA family protein|uniref:DnaA regulatory inactivator Hda n=2 Tax=Thiothrix TaxID=1030 RepID=A0A975FBJ7_9GAMM|nr:MULTISPECIES: DnaA regulatory inactivator Hda [Thiothrix]MDX9987958.1 DnaA regulatory inactivator Hda [Thiothrix unzii]QTR54479.1 DnaA regulatory inactivator Hda [Thiothrix unzii]
MMQQQLTLNVGIRDGHRFSSFFVTPENAELLGILKRGFEQHFPQIFLWGDTLAGKSHLLQACCENYYQAGLMAAYFPLKTCAQYGLRMLAGLENKHLVVIDELDAVIGQRDWEEALVHLINACRANNQPLLFAARTSPREMVCALPDFSSRLLWGPDYRVHVMSEEQCMQAMAWRAHQRGFELPTHVMKYIQRHYPHDIKTLVTMLNRLDAASLTKGRKVTREFIREVMQDSVSPAQAVLQ